ncbi:MAG: hypothetical protein KGJ86_22790, partial [Chloroflexota bacterium]|nr:hypothetical protein [Chloroflexota bacterium]
TLLWIREEIPPIAERHGFKVNPKKTRFQDARFGRRCVTGIMVDQDIHVPRSTRRALRAAMRGHPGSNKTRGLEEWCKLKPPKPGGSGRSGVYAATAAAHKAKVAFNDEAHRPAGK